ncbi:uncharacterized protein METZ01_LOCUS512747, partial [marine metagenome]
MNCVRPPVATAIGIRPRCSRAIATTGSINPTCDMSG